jgi:hypothetical protein
LTTKQEIVMASKTIAELCADLERAKESYVAAERRESIASGETTAALNTLNTCQKAVSAAMKELADNMPHDSEWKQHERLGQPVTG